MSRIYPLDDTKVLLGIFANLSDTETKKIKID